MLLCPEMLVCAHTHIKYSREDMRIKRINNFELISNGRKKLGNERLKQENDVKR